MNPITDEEFERLLIGFARESVHLEMRDGYGSVAELPAMARWAAGEPDDLRWLRGWCDVVAAHRAAGRSVRRARVVSEPLSAYQRWSYAVTQPMVDAGEDVRWVSRWLVSATCLPGNDFCLFDDRLVVFLHYTGDGLGRAKVASSDREVVALCRGAFEAVWALAAPHAEYQPV